MLWFIPTAESHNTSRSGWWNFPSSICAWKYPQSHKRRGWGQKSKLDILRQTVNQRKGLKPNQMLTLTVTNLHLRHVNRVEHNPLTSFLSHSDIFLVPEHQQWSFWVQKVSIFIAREWRMVAIWWGSASKEKYTTHTAVTGPLSCLSHLVDSNNANARSRPSFTSVVFGSLRWERLSKQALTITKGQIRSV